MKIDFTETENKLRINLKTSRYYSEEDKKEIRSEIE